MSLREVERLQRVLPAAEIRDPVLTQQYLSNLSSWATAQGMNDATSNFFSNVLREANRIFKDRPEDTRAIQMVLEEKSERYILEAGDLDSSETIVPVLIVKNPKSFLRKLAPLSPMIGPTIVEGADKRDIKRWAHHPEFSRFEAIWYNATPSDFAHPEQYIDKYLYQMTTDTFPELTGSAWHAVGEVHHQGQTIFVKNETPESGYEAPDGLRIALSNTSPSDVDELPSVYYRRTADDAAEIMAMQQQKTGGITKAGAKKLLQVTIDGNNIQTFIDHNHGIFTVDGWKLFRDLPRDELITRLKQIVASNEDRQSNMRKLATNSLRGVFTGEEQAPPGQLLSFIIACKLLRNKGITKISLPMYLPWRAHPADEDLNERVANNLANTALAAVNRIDGISHRNEPEDNDYINLELDDLSSEHPFFNHLLGSLN